MAAGRPKKAYHSLFNEQEKSFSTIGNMAIVPVRTDFRGPGPKFSGEGMDIIDEALYYFKPLVFFRNYEFEGNADRVLCYLVLYIQDCLGHLAKCSTKNEGMKKLSTNAMASFAIPGDGNFAFAGMYHKPANDNEREQLKQYMVQLRQEVGVRLCERVYATPDGSASKWWMCFNKKKFMNKNL